MSYKFKHSCGEGLYLWFTVLVMETTALNVACWSVEIPSKFSQNAGWAVSSQRRKWPLHNLEQMLQISSCDLCNCIGCSGMNTSGPFIRDLGSVMTELAWSLFGDSTWRHKYTKRTTRAIPVAISNRAILKSGSRRWNARHQRSSSQPVLLLSLTLIAEDIGTAADNRNLAIACRRKGSVIPVAQARSNNTFSRWPKVFGILAL